MKKGSRKKKIPVFVRTYGSNIFHFIYLSSIHERENPTTCNNTFSKVKRVYDKKFNRSSILSKVYVLKKKKKTREIKKKEQELNRKKRKKNMLSRIKTATLLVVQQTPNFNFQ